MLPGDPAALCRQAVAAGPRFSPPLVAFGRMMAGVEPWVVASRCGSYRSLFDRRTGLIARYTAEPILPRPEMIELAAVGPDGELLELEGLRELLDQAPLCRHILLTGDTAAHPALASILRTIRDHGVVPTAVVGATWPRGDALDALLRWSAAVGIDCGLDWAGLELITPLRDAGLRVHVHVPVADATVERAADLIERDAFERGIRSVVLTGRTVGGPGGRTAGLSTGPELERLVSVATRTHPYRVACDGRLGPILSAAVGGHPAVLAACEAGRSGIFVHHDLRVSPCSLIPDRVVGSLGDQSLPRIWRSPELVAFRREQRNGRPCSCTAWDVCRGGCPAAGKVCTDERRDPTLEAENGLDLRFGFATSSLCDRAHLPLERQQVVRTLTAVRAWGGLRFFDEDEASPQVAAAWSSLEYFLSLPSLWGQDLARLHEQLVAGTFEGSEVAPL